jgi:hypothetical protein
MAYGVTTIRAPTLARFMKVDDVLVRRAHAA